MWSLLVALAPITPLRDWYFRTNLCRVHHIIAHMLSEPSVYFKTPCGSMREVELSEFVTWCLGEGIPNAWSSPPLIPGAFDLCPHHIQGVQSCLSTFFLLVVGKVYGVVYGTVYV